MGTLVSGKEHKSGYESHPDYLLRVMPAGRHVRVTVDDELVAETEQALELFEADYAPVFYIPRKDVRMGLLKGNENRSWCPFKGEAHYWDFKRGEKEIPSVAWSYEDAFVEVSNIREYMAFYPDKAKIEAD